MGLPLVGVRRGLFYSITQEIDTRNRAHMENSD